MHVHMNFTIKSSSHTSEWLGVAMYMLIYLATYVAVFMYVAICISYNTGKSALPDIYAQRLRANAYISGKAQVPACVVTNILHFWLS